MHYADGHPEGAGAPSRREPTRTFGAPVGALSISRVAWNEKWDQTT